MSSFPVVVVAVFCVAAALATPVWMETCETEGQFNQRWTLSSAGHITLDRFASTCLARNASGTACYGTGAAAATVPCSTSPSQLFKFTDGRIVVASTQECLSRVPGQDTVEFVDCTSASSWLHDDMGRLHTTNDSAVCLHSGAPVEDAPPGTLLMVEDFDGSAINESRWQVLQQIHRGGLYTSANVVVEGGVLKLLSYPFPEPVSVNNKTFFMSSGAVNSSGLVERVYGKWVIRAQLPDVDATAGWTGHNSMWLINDRGQEIDVFEQTASHEDPGTNASVAAGNLHAKQCPAPDQCPNTGACVRFCDGCGQGGHFGIVKDWTSDFHEFSIEVRPDAITWQYDNVTVSTMTNTTVIGQYNNPQFLALTACVMVETAPQPGDLFPQVFSIDWVKLYA